MAAQPISIQEALSIVCDNVKPGATEVVPVTQAVGRVIAADLFSDIDVTPFDDSAMDGFGVIAADLEAATADAPVALTCVAHLGAGAVYDGVVQPGQCVRIMTGAMVPDGVDSVVKIEIVTFSGEGGVGDTISFSAPTKLGSNIRKAGDEAHEGDLVLPAGEVLNPAGAGLLAACGNLNVPVYRRPVVGLICIGSELVEADQRPGKGMIRNSNIWSMQAFVAAAGGVPRVYPTVADDEAAIRALFAQAVAECDMVVSTGGACDGDFDLTPRILRELGTQLIQRIDMKPGKSQPFGLVDGKPVFVLSGNPGASSVGFEMFCRPAIRLLQGFTDVERPSVMARITAPVRKKDPRTFLERAILTQAPDGTLEVTTMKNQSSALFGAMQRANCLAIIPQGVGGVDAGDQVKCIIISGAENLPFRA